MSSSQQVGLVTPEAVRLDLRLAGVGSRTLSILLDLLVMAAAGYVTLLLLLFSFGAAAGAGVPPWVGIVVALAAQFFILWGYPVICETVFTGRTLGKLVMGLRVVTVDGAPIRFRHAAIRGLLAYPDIYLTSGIGAAITALVTGRSQRLGDLAAGTLIVRDRRRGTATDQPVRWHIPDALRPYASTLDVRALQAQDYATIREFLLRSGELDPSRRDGLAAELAAATASRMRHVIPQGVHPEALLLCVVTLVQERAPIVASQPPVDAASPPPLAPPDGGFAAPS